LPEKRKCTKTRAPEAENPEARGLGQKIMNFFKLLEEMETKKIPEKSGRRTGKGPVGSKIDYAYRIKIIPERRVRKPRKPLS